MNHSRRFLRYLRGTFAILAGVLVLLTALTHASQASNDFSYNVAVNYRVSSDDTTRVQETYSVTNHTNNKYLSSIQLSTPTDDVKNLSVEYSDGTSIPFTTEKKHTEISGYPYDYVQININFSRQVVVPKWSFVVRYDTTKLVESKGGAHTVYIPAIAQDTSDTYQVSVSVPENFGTLHTTGPKPNSQSSKNNLTTYIFDKKDLSEKSLALVFGDSTVYKLNFNFPLNNETPATQSFTIALPPNTSGQQIIIRKLDPQPKRTHLDSDGNILADYEVPAHTKIIVKTDVEAVIRYLDYDLKVSGNKTEIPKELVNRYTRSQRYWPSNNAAVIAKARELTKDKKTVAEQVQSINNYVIETLSYNNEKIKYNIRQGGLKALENPTNVVCLEYSDLSITLLRAAGIPARMPIGYGYSGELKQSNSVSDSLHSWVQAYVPNIGWMNVDPTWGEKFHNFGTSDLDHVAFAIWGQSDDSPVAVTEAGNDVNYQYEATKIEYEALPSIIAPDGKLSGSKWQILPFLSFAKYNVEAPTSTAGENYLLQIQAGKTNVENQLGSLAPQEKTIIYRPEFGWYAMVTETVEFNQRGQASLILATTKVSPVSWPMWIILAAITGIIIWKLLQLRTKKNKHEIPVSPHIIPTISEAPLDKGPENEQSKSKPPNE